MTNFKSYFSFRYTELLVSLKYASRDVHLLVANPLGKKCHSISVITVNRVTASRENLGTIPIVRGKENSERASTQMQEGKWKAEKKSQNREKKSFQLKNF